MVLIVSAVFPPEPVVSAKLSYDLASELSSKYNVNVISPRPSRPYGFKFETVTEKFAYKHEIIESYVCPQSNHFGRLRESYSFGRASRRYIFENRDEISVIYLITWPLFAQYFVVHEAAKHNIPVILHVQDVYPESLTNKYPTLGSIINRILLLIDKYTLKNSKAIIAISEKMGAYLIKSRGIKNSKIYIIPNWQDETSFYPQDEKLGSVRAGDEPFTFMYLGNIGPVAGVELIIDAFSSSGLENCRLVIAGSGSMKADAIKRAQKKQEEKIEFWDVPDGKVADVQSKADVLLLPVRKGISISSIPSKLPAYLFSAKPIIASVENDSDIANVILNSGCGWLVEPGNEKELASQMKFVLSLDKHKLKEIGINGRNYALENFSKQKNLQYLVQILESIISREVSKNLN